MWPVRRHRRHEGTEHVNAEVLNALSSITSRLDSIESRLSDAQMNSETKIHSPPGLSSKVAHYVQPEVGAKNGNADLVKSFQDGLDDIAKRVTLLEKVFVLTDFDALEAAADKIVNTVKEPEAEESPLKPKASDADATHDEEDKPSENTLPRHIRFPSDDLEHEVNSTAAVVSSSREPDLSEKDALVVNAVTRKFAELLESKFKI